MAKTIQTTGNTLQAAYLNFLNFMVPTGEDDDGSGPLLHNVSAGSTTVYTLSLAYNGTNFPNAAYSAGLMVTFRAHAGNTGASTININGIGAKAIRRLDGTALSSGDFTTNDFVMLIFDATADYFRWISSPHEHAGAGDGGNTLDTPTISDFTNAGHDHSDTANGGDLGVVQATNLTLTGAAPANPVANRLYKDNIPKFWVNYDGAGGGTFAPRGDFNVDSITDGGAGNQTVNIATDFANTNWAPLCSSSAVAQTRITAIAVGNVTIETSDIVGVPVDVSTVTVCGFGDQT